MNGHNRFLPKKKSNQNMQTAQPPYSGVNVNNICPVDQSKVLYDILASNVKYFAARFNSWRLIDKGKFVVILKQVGKSLDVYTYTTNSRIGSNL